MSRPRLTGVRRLREIARDDPAAGRVVTLVTGLIRFPDRDAATREASLAGLRKRLERRYRPGDLTVQVQDNLHEAGFVFTPAG